MSHEFAETAFGEFALFEPLEVFLGEIEDRDAGGRVIHLSKDSEGHVGALDFREQVAEVLKIDFCEFHVTEREACGAAGVG